MQNYLQGSDYLFYLWAAKWLGGLFMSFFELLLLAIGVSMDAFAVSICKGLAMPRSTLKAPNRHLRPWLYETIRADLQGKKVDVPIETTDGNPSLTY